MIGKLKTEKIVKKKAFNGVMISHLIRQHLRKENKEINISYGF